MTDLLWSDPSSEVDGFVRSPRGVSYQFGKNELQKFLKLNGFSLVVRSHEFCQEGIHFPFGKNGGIVTVFSAANYCNSSNSSAVLNVDENLLLHFTCFHIENDGQEHPHDVDTSELSLE